MIYFNNAATSSYKPPYVMRALIDGSNNNINLLRSGGHSSVISAVAVNNSRNSVANLFNCNNHNVIFTNGCTMALNLAIFGIANLPLKLPFHIISTVMEHNSVLRPLYELQRLGAQLTFLSPDDSGSVPIEMLKLAITKETKLIVAVHCSNVTGGTNDINAFADIANNNNIPFIADIAQSAGYFPVNLNNIDMAALPAHKGLCGIGGNGALIMNKNITLKPFVYGGTGVMSHIEEMPDFSPERYEAGTQNIGGILALGAAANWTKENMSKMQYNRNYLQKYITENLQKMKAIRLISVPNSCGIVSFVINQNGFDSMLLSSNLSDKFDIITRGGLHCAPLIHKHLNTFETGALRISASGSNTIHEADALIYAIDKLCNNDANINNYTYL
ncbi:MAG: aminotransferase class V-fold PLP-dependent enzyme [Clostridia bacterium]